MSAAWIVTPAGGGEPYHVTLRREGGGWTATVERNGEQWSLDVPAGGLARAGGRPLRWWWEPNAGRLVLNGRAHALRVESEAAHRLASAAGRGGAAARVEEVRAPMPGLVLTVEAAAGTAVRAGQGLFVLEAMKMENEITAPAAGVVRDVAVAAGTVVERGALLCRIAPPAEGA